MTDARIIGDHMQYICYNLNLINFSCTVFIAAETEDRRPHLDLGRHGPQSLHIVVPRMLTDTNLQLSLSS